MIAVIDTNHLLRLAATMDRSPLFAAWRDGRFDLAAVAAQAEVIVTTDRDLLDDDRLKAQLLERWKMCMVESAEFLAMV